MTPENQRIAIAKACGLKLRSESEMDPATPTTLDEYSWRKMQHVCDGWVSTSPRNPKGVWVLGDCSQAVADKTIAEKWAAQDPGDSVVAVKMLRDAPDYLNDLNALRDALKLVEYGKQREFMGHPHSTYEGVSPLGDRVLTIDMFPYLPTHPWRFAEAFLKTLGLWTED